MHRSRQSLTFALTGLLFFLLFVKVISASGPALFQTKPGPFADSLQKKFRLWKKAWPQERLFLSTDKPLYEPGETIWFSAVLVSETSLGKPALSEILYVDLLNPKGAVEKQFSLIARGGKANGDYFISPDAAGGSYKLKAYTKWMQANGKEFTHDIQIQESVLPRLLLQMELKRTAYKPGDKVEADFEAKSLSNQPFPNALVKIMVQAGDKTIVEQGLTTDVNGKCLIQFELPALPAGARPTLTALVQQDGETESVTRSIPLADNGIQVYFFPEGGDFLQNQECRMAFRVLKSDSTGADAEGWLMNQKGEKLQLVRTLHKGMGSFDFVPKAGEQYRVEWKSPIETSTGLPEPLEKGYSLSVRSAEQELLVRTRAPGSENLLVVAQMRGKWLWDQKIKTDGSSELKIPTQKWPSGVCVVSLFDGRGLLRSERRIFVHLDKRLKISVKTGKEKYQTREKVDLQVRVSDPKGVPVPGMVGVAVVSEAVLGYANDKQGNLVSSLLLEQDLETKLEDPTFYFSQRPLARPALDLVMLTYGWRGLTWKKILEEPFENPGFKPERAVLSGTLMNSMDNQPLKGGKLQIGKIVVFSDSSGHFKFPFIDLSKPVELKISKGKERVEVQTLNRYSEEMVLYYNPFPVLYEKHEIPMAMNAAADVEMAPGLRKEGQKEMRKALPPNAKARKAPVAAPKGAEMKELALQKGAPVPPRRIRPFPEPQKPEEMQPVYYLARTFPNLPPAKTNERTDFRTTLFWSGMVDLDLNGRGSFSFYTGDDISAYRATAQAIGPEGLLGMGEARFSTELPVSVSTKLPAEMQTGDRAVLGVVVRNKTNQPKSGQLEAFLGDALKAESTLPANLDLKPQESREILLPVLAVRKADSVRVRLRFQAGDDVDIWEQTVRILPQGYPVQVSVSGREMTKVFNAEIRNMIPGSMEVHATAFPDVTSDLLAGVESILAEPFGCFEQTSMTSYPNVLVLNYLKASGQSNPALASKAEALLEKGYKRLTSFETSQKGYEWFGGAPAHEALTAYGLMQFKDMQKVAPYVDAGMVDRTAQWLLNRRDGKGGFLRSGQALDNFGRANEAVTNAYIVYSLAEAGYQQLDLEVKKVTEVALASKDPYQLALVANTLWLIGNKDKAMEVTRVLLGLQAGDGSWTGSTHSITYSTGQALTVETTGFSIMALIRAENIDRAKVEKAVAFLCSQRQGGGGFGNSQSTIVALKALTHFVVFSKRTKEDGAFTLKVNGKDAGGMDWKAGTQKAIVLKGWEKLVMEGQNILEFNYQTLTEPLPFTVGLDYFTSLPPTDPASKVSLQTKMSSGKVALGSPVQMEITLENKTQEGLPMTMACVPIPGGCTAPPSLLRELVQTKQVDFFETRGNTLFLYYRQMTPGETRKVVLNLTPVIRGKFKASAASAYLYYTAERKHWCPGPGLEID